MRWLGGVLIFSLFFLIGYQLRSDAAVTLTFTWTPPTTDVDGAPAVIGFYTMYRSTDGGVTYSKFPCSEQVSDTNLLGLLCTDPSLPTGTDCYQVTASNLVGESTPSNRLCFQVPGAKPSSPTNLHTK